MFRRRHKHQENEPVTRLLHHEPADSPGYTRLYMLEPIGTTQAGAVVKATVESEDRAHEILLHGQREFDVPDGSYVTFPDGSTLDLR